MVLFFGPRSARERGHSLVRQLISPLVAVVARMALHPHPADAVAGGLVVEALPQTWERAGFATMSDEDTRDYVGGVFSKDLHGNPLLSNNSKWINFLLVKNTDWFFDNVILLGDALHTAHFSIGSGTKLAMEDAIALAQSFTTTSDVREALKNFTETRRPVIEDYQAAAFESMRWFENASQYMHLTPMELALSVMTRSGRVSIEDLKKRSPEFIHRYNELTPGGRL